MEVCVIASGSNGNCCLVENKNTSVLIDAGLSGKEIEHRMNKLGKSLENINGIVLTHAHSDHYRGVGILSRKYNIPAYMTKTVYQNTNLGNIKVKYFNNTPFKIGNLKIEPVTTSHDIPSCGFRIGKFGIFTDTGIATKEMETAMKRLKAAVIESNHDIDMLMNGSYPAFLKKRIISDNGHLSNTQASTFINNFGKTLNTALLGHLSGNNNTPQIAKQTFETLVKQKIECNILSRDKESGSWKV